MVILFDIDGTLIDHDGAEAKAVRAFHAMTMQDEDLAGFLQRWRRAFERHYNRYLAGELSLQQQRRERFRELLDSGLSDGDADRLSASYIDTYLQECRAYDDVAPVLAILAGNPMGIISNGDLSQQQYKLEKAGIRHYFSSLTLSAECGMCKPAPGIFELACDTMKVHPSEAVYVGDRSDIDAEAARRAGMHGIWLDRYGAPTPPNDDSLCRIHSLSELPPAIAFIEEPRQE
jgi:putative hydrolase of the HAD superfamily